MKISNTTLQIFKNSEDNKVLLQDEAFGVYQLMQKNFLREIYFDDAHCAVIILVCTNRSEAKLLLGELRLVKNGIIEFQITERKSYVGFSRISQV